MTNNFKPTTTLYFKNGNVTITAVYTKQGWQLTGKGYKITQQYFNRARLIEFMSAIGYSITE